jgi:enoyl-[acyl-carrier protein] reductase I
MAAPCPAPVRARGRGPTLFLRAGNPAKVRGFGPQAGGGREKGMTAGAPLMKGKRGLIMGVANDHSIAWGIAQAVAAHGAALSFSFQGESVERRVRPLAESVGARLVQQCDVEDDTSIDALFDAAEGALGGLDFVVHSIAYSDRHELQGRYIDTTRANFGRTMMISCYSLTAVARRAAALMDRNESGGSLLTLTYDGSQRVMPSYNVMGVAKAALEASVRYLAMDLGRQKVRVNAISAGPMRTLAGAAVKDSRYVYRWAQDNAPLRRNVALEEVGNAGLYLLSDLSAGVTGEVHYVDAGYNVVGMCAPPR